jgi:hypothetical protein
MAVASSDSAATMCPISRFWASSVSAVQKKNSWAVAG